MSAAYGWRVAEILDSLALADQGQEGDHGENGLSPATTA